MHQPKSVTFDTHVFETSTTLVWLFFQEKKNKMHNTFLVNKLQITNKLTK